MTRQLHWRWQTRVRQPFKYPNPNTQAARHPTKYLKIQSASLHPNEGRYLNVLTNVKYVWRLYELPVYTQPPFVTVGTTYNASSLVISNRIFWNSVFALEAASCQNWSAGGGSSPIKWAPSRHGVPTLHHVWSWCRHLHHVWCWCRRYIWAEP